MKAVVTGGTKGIGRAIVELFLEKEIDVCLCSRNEKELQDLKAVLTRQFPTRAIHVCPADLSKKAAVLSFAIFVKSQWGQVDILVNNAGLFLPGEIHKEDDGTLESQIETNLYSAYHLTRALLDLMLPFKTGHIFNMCSIASFMAYPNGGSYSISKFALLGFSKVLRKEMEDKGIKVTAVMPGATWSNSWTGVDLPHQRLMKAEDIAQAVYSASRLSPAAVVEEIILRPQLGDL